MKTRLILGLLVGLAGVREVHATTCKPITPSTNALKTSGDTRAMERWGCKVSTRNYMWDAYDMDTADWNEGFGFDAPCDITQPLARTYNAIYVLHNSASDPATDPDDRNGSILRWAGQYAAENIDELDARCGDTDPNKITFASSQITPFKDQWTRLYMPFFYQLNVVSRASVILHESRHAGGYDHDAANDECSRGASCDSSWSYVGANRYEVRWLWEFFLAGVDPGGNEEDLDRARKHAFNRGNHLLLESFANPPGWVIPDLFDDSFFHLGGSVWDEKTKVSAFTSNGLKFVAATDTSGRLRIKTHDGQGWSKWKVTSGVGEFARNTEVTGVNATTNELDLFAVDVDGRVRNSHFNYFFGWKYWETTVGTRTFPQGTRVSAVSRSDKKIDLFAVSFEGRVWNARYNGSTWGEWTSVQPATTFPLWSQIAAISKSPGTIDLFLTAWDGKIKTSHYGFLGWSAWSNVSDKVFPVLTPVTGVSRMEGILDIFAVDAEGATWNRTYYGDFGWLAWTNMGGVLPIRTPINVVARTFLQLDIFAVAEDAGIWTQSWSNGWSGWIPLGRWAEVFHKNQPVAVVSTGMPFLDIFAVEPDGRVYASFFNSTFGWYGGVGQRWIDR